MTLRAVLLGLFGAVFMCAFTYFNDHIIRQTWFIFASMPTAVYGGLLFVVLVVGPALAYLRKRWRLTGSELAVALALTLVPCCIPGAGLLETFPNVVMMPHHISRTDPGWVAEDATGMVPPRMLADTSQDEDRALNGYVQGLSTGERRISFWEVPWSAWARTLAFWLPLVLLLWITLIGLSLVVHRQWSEHEKLPYPIATFTESLLPREGGAGRPVHLDRLFWLGCGLVCFVHLTHYLTAWWPDYVVALPRRFDLSSLSQLLPTLTRGGGGRLLRPILVFTVIGLTYFLPKDMSFSLGIGPYIYCYVAGILAGFGVSMSQGGWYTASLRPSLQAGAYIGMLLLVIYTGRRYYASVFRLAFGFKSADPVEPYAVWGARAFVAGSLLFMTILTVAGLDWPLAIAYTLLLIAAYILIGRLSAETGFLFIQPGWEPAMLIVGFTGVRAIGPSMAVMMFLLSSALILDTREAMVPYVVNSLRIIGGRKLALGRTSVWCVVALLVGMAVAVPVTLYIKYDQGTNLWYHWVSYRTPRYAFDAGIRVKQRLRSQGELEAAESVSGWGRLLALSPNRTFLVGFGTALALFLGLSAARLRFAWWPLHPVLLLIWATYPGRMLSASFLIGFAIKWAVVKYGGDRMYRRLKPIMIGLIAGDMLFGLSTSVIGAVYYFVTGVPPPRFSALW